MVIITSRVPSLRRCADSLRLDCFETASSAQTYFLIAILSILNNLSFAQCSFRITHDNTDDHCLYAVEDVVWTSAVGVTVSGVNLLKNTINNNWDAGAISLNKVKNNGWATTTILETNKTRRFGLAFNPSALPSEGRAQFAIHFGADGKFGIYESTSHRGDPAGENGNNTYKVGDIFKIEIDNNVVRYYQNATLLYTSLLTPSLPLVVVSTMHTPNSTMTNTMVYNGSDGRFNASGSNLGANPSYQWYVNNILQNGANTATYSNNLLTSGDVLTCTVVPDVGGCSVGPVTSNAIRFQNIPATVFGQYNVINGGSPTACFVATEPAIFLNSINLDVYENDLSRSCETGVCSTSGAFSLNTVVDKGSVKATATETNTGRMFGLSASNASYNFGSIEYAFYLRGDAKFEVYELNSPRYGPINYNTSDIFKIAIEENKVKYYVNNSLVYISNQVPAASLNVKAIFFNKNASINDVMISNGTIGNFTTRAVPSLSPTYQWIWNGADIPGAVSSTFSNGSMADADYVNCKINPGLVGCSPIITRQVDISATSFPGSLYIAGMLPSSSCIEARESVSFTDKQNVLVSGNSISKIYGGGSDWNGGATSANVINNNGYAEAKVTNAMAAVAFGISPNNIATTHTNADLNSIFYGIALRGDGQADIYESGVRRTTTSFLGGILANDVFRIQIDYGVVKYLRNGNSFYTSSRNVLSTEFPLVVDLSFNSMNSTLSDIVVSNGQNGTFQAVTANYGAAPSYQWKLNFVNVGSNSPLYTPNGLSTGDVLQCLVKPDVPGCGQVLSNSIEVTGVGGLATTTWTGATSSEWFNNSNWSNGIPKGHYNVNIPSGRPNYPVINTTSSNAAAVYDLIISNGASLTVSGSSTMTVFDDYNNQGTFTPSTSTIAFKACTNNKNNISSAVSEAFHKVVINNVNGVEVSGEHHVLNELTFSAGIIDYTDANSIVVFDDGAQAVGASNTSHINGKVKKIGNDSFTFPIGKNGVYGDLSISAPTNLFDHFTAEYFKTNPTSIYGDKVLNGIWTVSGCEHWRLDQSGVSNVAVTLSWNQSRNCQNPPYITDPTSLLVSYWSGGQWEDGGSSNVTGDENNGYITSSKPLSYNTAFTLASWTSANPLPIDLARFEAKVISQRVILTWTTLTESNSAWFIIQRSFDGMNFEGIDSARAAGNSKTQLTYHYSDNSIIASRRYYRLKMVDIDGQYKYSPLLSAIINDDNTFMLYPNPAQVGQRIYFSDRSERGEVTDILHRKVTEIPEGSDSIDTTGFLPGIYLYREPQRIYRFVIR